MTQRTNLIGLTGKIGAGKDTVFQRLQAVHGAHLYKRVSFAEPLKTSVAALLGLTTEQVEAMKNEPTIRVSILDTKGAGRDMGRSFSMRELLQRFGTEVGRDIYGKDFWVDLGMKELQQQRTRDAELRVGPYTYVFTDVRFDNEARAIRNYGGKIYQVVGPDIDTGSHASEGGVHPDLIDGVVMNTVRPDYSMDPKIAQTLSPTERDEISAQRRGEALSALDDEVALLHIDIFGESA